jgi:hypothetical protein
MPITIVTPASVTALCLLSDLKDDLGISGSSEDARLNRMIAQATSAIQTFCNRDFSYRVVDESIKSAPYQRLKLRINPVQSVTSVTFKGTTVDTSKYILEDASAGLLYNNQGWEYDGDYQYVVRYACGYRLPSDSGSGVKLPVVISEAALKLAALAYSTRGSTTTKLEEQVEGVGKIVYGRSNSSASFVSGGDMPAYIQTGLLPFREFVL